MSYEVLVIGGGIQGAGIAQACAAAGYRVALLEKDAWGGGTSCKSSKLVHGGLRYLESGQLRLVYESLAERAILLRIAPHLVRPVPFLIPLYRHSRRAPAYVGLGLWLYRLLGWRYPYSDFRRLAPADWADLDGLQQRDLRAVYAYWDAQTDDAALTRAVVASAGQLGAQALCPAEVRAIDQTERGYRIHLAAGQSLETRCLINATGPWANELLRRVTPVLQPQAVELVRGSHIELAAPAPERIYYLESPLDQRVFFVMPWQGRRLVGTTEALHQGGADGVQPSPAEIAYLLQSYQTYFAPAPLEGSWAGLRVLPKREGAAFGRSRETLFHCDRGWHPLLLTVYGGKLTTYRATGERVAAWVKTRLGPRTAQADTRTLVLP